MPMTKRHTLSHVQHINRRALVLGAARIIESRGGMCRTQSALYLPIIALSLSKRMVVKTMLLNRVSVLSSGVVGASRRGFASARPLSKEYQNLLVSRPKPNVTLLTLNRPKALNALSTPLFDEINEVLDQVEKDEEIGALVVTGSEKAFAAGADIKEMKDKEFTDVYKNNFLGDWTRITSFRKPVIAAVSGFALGGGCELAMMCDIILASPTARFGQPEIKLGVIPGAGGTQRLTHAIGKSRAMELVLTGRMITAQEAEKWGLVSRIVEGDVVEEAVSMANTIAGFGRVAVQAGKESVNAAYELSLKDGLHFERRIFQSLFATRDQKEGMWYDSMLAARKEALGLRDAFTGGILQLLNPFSWGVLAMVARPTPWHKERRRGA